MSIYKIDTLSEALGMRSIFEANPNYVEDNSIPEDAVFTRGHSPFPYNMEGENNPFHGKKHSPEAKEKMRIAKLGKKRAPHSEETKRKMSESAMGKPGTNTGKTFIRNDEHKKNISEATKKAMKGFDPSKRWKEVCCPHCNKYGKGPNMTRYHFDNCKMRNDA